MTSVHQFFKSNVSIEKNHFDRIVRYQTTKALEIIIYQKITVVHWNFPTGNSKLQEKCIAKIVIVALPKQLKLISN